MTCRKEIHFSCQCSIEDIYHLCESVDRIDIFRIVLVEKENNRITLIHKADFTSNGEKIFLHLKPNEDKSTEIHAISQSFTPFRMFDWGRNATNLLILESYFSKFSKSMGKIISE